MKKRIIWSNMDINFDQWKEDLIQFRREFTQDDPEDISDNDVWDFINESLDNQLDDEETNLDIPLDNRILAIADLGLWDGRKQGYKILKGNIKNIFNVSEDYNEYYSDGHDIKATCSHHDGTNYITFRMIREERNIENLLNAIINREKISHQKLNYYTMSLHKLVANIYGW